MSPSSKCAPPRQRSSRRLLCRYSLRARKEGLLFSALDEGEDNDRTMCASSSLLAFAKVHREGCRMQQRHKPREGGLRGLLCPAGVSSQMPSSAGCRSHASAASAA